MAISIRQAESSDIAVVSSILSEAARWLEQRGVPLWRADELNDALITQEVGQKLYFLAECDGEPGGVIRYQLSDPIFWPEALSDDAAYVHRLSVRRRFAGGAVSTALLAWAVDRTGALGCPALRLDCEASRLRLRALYESFGFKYHSERQVGPYVVARYEFRVRNKRCISLTGL